MHIHIYMLSWKQCALPVITTVGCGNDSFHDSMYITLVLLLWGLSTQCRGSLMTTYIMPLVFLVEHSLVHWYQQCVTIHHVSKCISCHKGAVVITGRAHCFHDSMYITLVLLLWDLNTLCVVDHLWPLIYIYTYIYTYIHIHNNTHIHKHICINWYIIPYESGFKRAIDPSFFIWSFLRHTSLCYRNEQNANPKATLTSSCCILLENQK